MHPYHKLELANIITEERIREARREHLLHQHDRSGDKGPVVRFREMVKGVSVTLRGLGHPHAPAAAPSR